MMYILLIAALLAVGVGLVNAGSRRKNKSLMAGGLAVWAVTAVFFGLLNLWGEMLWFENLGYAQRFWSVLLTRLGVGALAAVCGAAFVYLLTLPLHSGQNSNRAAQYVPAALAAVLGAIVGAANWAVVLRFLHRVPFGVADPILDRDAGFYIFSLPLLDLVYVLLMLWLWIALLATVMTVFMQMQPGNRVEWHSPESREKYTPLYLILGVGLIVYGGGQCLKVFRILYSRTGIVAGAGWTDVYVRMPAYRVVAFVAILAGILLLVPKVRDWMRRGWRRTQVSAEACPLLVAGTPIVLVLLLQVVGLVLLPVLSQWLRVQPNEISMERPYIEHNIKFTRRAFDLQDIEVRDFPVSDTFTRALVERNQDLLDDIRLWDWRALQDVYQQFQEIRLYYKFHDVDIDRYQLGDAYRQVMVSAREMDLESLPRKAQTFINKRFKYTHGYGMTLAGVNEFTPQGLPNLLISDIPPQTDYTNLHLTQPEIYYGELTRTPVVVNSQEKEFDYPAGDHNVYSHYQGQGGVKLSNLWRKFLFGWKFDGTRFLLSGYPHAESRIMFHRQVRERVRRLAPFLRLEDDPYIVNHDGRQYWILDAYTVSARYPYSERFLADSGRRWQSAYTGNPNAASQLSGVNYARNAVKVVIDAYDGAVDFYVFEPDDPLIRCWQGIFPDLFKDADAMPEGLRAHVRYPEAFLLAQGLVYAKYHMQDPTVFYNLEDLWVRGTEKYYQQDVEVDPYYIMWKTTAESEPEFTLILPFTPKNKQVMIGWLAGLCDGENYGRLLAYKFPKEKRILGPQQVETKIDQDAHLSGQMTLWSQRGSHVIRGNVLAIPIEDTIIYVEPIYLKASSAAYPELRLVAVMHNDDLSYAETFSEAIEGLLAGDPRKDVPMARQEPGTTSELGRKANEAFDAYLRLMEQKQFPAAARELETLQQALQKLAGGSLAEEE